MAEGGPLSADRIRRLAGEYGHALPPDRAQALADHARAVLAANEHLHLTSIVDPEAFLERHIGEGFAGAALLPPGVRGRMVDLGSGNGYPALPVAAVHPGLRLELAEAGRAKAEFLAGLGVAVVARQVQRPADLPSGDPIRVLTTRAMGGWQKIVPRMAPALAQPTDVLVWAGEEMAILLGRSVWKRYRLLDRVPIAGTDRSFIWHLGAAAPGHGLSKKG